MTILSSRPSTRHLGAACLLGTALLAADPRSQPSMEVTMAPATSWRPREVSHLVGQTTDRRAVVSVMSSDDAEALVESGRVAGSLDRRSAPRLLQGGVPAEFVLDGLTPDSTWYYRVLVGRPGAILEAQGLPEVSFRTQRSTDAGFVFTVQGDSHPERAGRMFDADLYRRTLANVAADGPDFHFLMGDDFSIERIIERGPPRGRETEEAVNAVYANQRSFLGVVGRSAPLMLVNGNHEQAARYLLDGTPGSFAVLAGRARTTYFPLPVPDGFYSGNTTPVEHLGLPRDHYAWEWGDALFVVIDPYWHSEVAVDNEAGSKGPQRGAERARGGGKGNRDLWQITLGDDQYRWLRATLTESRARFKFVFSHHVSGTGRGGVEVAPYYEWGGQDRRGGGRRGEADAPATGRPAARGLDRFFQARPTWEQPIHDLMRDSGVTIFFQGHDHLYARQELDGVVYQTCPNPADPTFTAFNRDAYRSGDIHANSGHLRVTIRGADGAGGPPSCSVEYVRSARPGDEARQGANGTIVHQYVVGPRAPQPAPSPPRGRPAP